jgi:hypothetical protein
MCRFFHDSFSLDRKKVAELIFSSRLYNDSFSLYGAKGNPGILKKISGFSFLAVRYESMTSQLIPLPGLPPHESSPLGAGDKPMSSNRHRTSRRRNFRSFLGSRGRSAGCFITNGAESTTSEKMPLLALMLKSVLRLKRISAPH